MTNCVCYPGTAHSDGCPEGNKPMTSPDASLSRLLMLVERDFPCTSVGMAFKNGCADALKYARPENGEVRCKNCQLRDLALSVASAAQQHAEALRVHATWTENYLDYMETEVGQLRAAADFLSPKEEA